MMGSYQVSVPPGESRVRVELRGDSPRDLLSMDLEPGQARQFATWLNQGADWVDQQDDEKGGR